MNQAAFAARQKQFATLVHASSTGVDRGHEVDGLLQVVMSSSGNRLGSYRHILKTESFGDAQVCLARWLVSREDAWARLSSSTAKLMSLLVPNRTPSYLELCGVFRQAIRRDRRCHTSSVGLVPNRLGGELVQTTRALVRIADGEQRT